MKISSVEHNAPRRGYKPAAVKAGGGGKDFSSTLDMARREQLQVEEMLDKIKSAGEKLKRTKSKDDVIVYKEQIQTYLSFVLENYYRIKQDYGMGRLLIRVEVINKKIEELTSALLEQQKANFEIVGSVDEITGLLLDLYH